MAMTMLCDNVHSNVHMSPVAFRFLSAQAEGTQWPQKQVLFSEDVREDQAHQWPRMRSQYKMIINYSKQEAGTSPDPNPIVVPGEGAIIRQARVQTFCSPGKEPCCAFPGESRVDEEEGKATQILERTCSSSSKDGYFTQKCGTREKRSGPGSLILIQLSGRRASPLP